MNYREAVEPFTTVQEVAEKTAPLLRSGRVAISGGSTYGTLFDYWVKAAGDTIGATFFPVDERVVPFEDEASNWRVVKERLFDPIGDTESIDHLGNNFTAYEELLIREFQGETPDFDVLFLGVGDDGHTASLFPGGKYLSDRTSNLLETVSPKEPAERVSLSPKAILNAQNIVVIIDGKNKKQIVERILQEDVTLPIVQILKEVNKGTLYINKELLED